MSDVIMVNTEYIPGKRIVKVFGTIWGITVRSRGLGGNLVAGLRSLAGGEIKEYTKMLSDARNTAMERLQSAADQIGANAVINVRFDSSDIGQVMTEIVAYGTAVLVEDVTDNIQRVGLS
ncbi:MAG: heavy metal-binding domain-containing protein [Thermoplasma acidophilum]|nr:heavy metal-binding domain-containing protein [Thermoplasma acidophilum]